MKFFSVISKATRILCFSIPHKENGENQSIEGTLHGQSGQGVSTHFEITPRNSAGEITRGEVG